MITTQQNVLNNSVRGKARCILQPKPKKKKQAQDATRKYDVAPLRRRLEIHDTRLKELENAVRAHGKSIKQLTASLEKFNAQTQRAKGL